MKKEIKNILVVIVFLAEKNSDSEEIYEDRTVF